MVPQGPQDTPRSVQDSSRHGRFTASESGEDSLFLPVPGQIDDEGGAGDPTRSVVRESDTESIICGASSTSQNPAWRSRMSAQTVGKSGTLSPYWMSWTSKSCFREERIAMEEATHAQAGRHERGRKLFMLLPNMLLHRPSSGGNIPKNKLVSRFDDFSAGRWDVLIRASEVCVTGRRVLPAQGSGDICECATSFVGSDG